MMGFMDSQREQMKRILLKEHVNITAYGVGRRIERSGRGGSHGHGSFPLRSRAIRRVMIIFGRRR